MKSYLFTTDNDRGGVMLCDIDTLEDAVVYLHERFPGVIRVEQGKDYWTEVEGYIYLNPSNDPPSATIPPS